jgi:hypothetical protein
MKLLLLLLPPSSLSLSLLQSLPAGAAAGSPRTNTFAMSCMQPAKQAECV